MTANEMNYMANSVLKSQIATSKRGGLRYRPYRRVVERPRLQVLCVHEAGRGEIRRVKQSAFGAGGKARGVV